MTFRTFTLDLVERVHEIDDRLSEIEERKLEIESEVAQAMQDQQVDFPSEIEEWESLCDEDDELSTEETKLIGQRRAFMDTIAHWKTDLDVTENPSRDEVEEAVSSVSECLFVVEELSYGQIQSVQDDMMEKSFEVDVEKQDYDGTPKQGYMQIEMIREALVEWPEEAPTRSAQFGHGDEPEPGDYPEEVAQWLFDRIDALNTTQERDLGNLSLEERMRLER